MELSEGLLIHFPLAFKKDQAASGTTYSTGWINVRGQARIEGIIRTNKLPDDGFPEIAWSSDGQNADQVIVIQQLPSPGVAAYVYEVDFRNVQRFVRIRFKQSTGAPATFRWELYAKPVSGGPQL